jgi:uncharacterized membrane protein
MSKSRHDAVHHTCQICGKSKPFGELVPGDVVRPAIVERIVQAFPAWSGEGYICLNDLNRFRANYVQWLLEQEKGELSTLEQSVIESMARHETLSSNIELAFQKDLTIGERLADRVADFGGSWVFISIFAGFILVWMAINSVLLMTRAFDPYPYILLNLVLSCLAAVQAPIIMMSQNRQEARDRLRAENDYQVNLKAELEIRHLHEKLDYLIRNQWERLMEVQQIQVELMNELGRIGQRRS